MGEDQKEVKEQGKLKKQSKEIREVKPLRHAWPGVFQAQHSKQGDAEKWKLLSHSFSLSVSVSLSSHTHRHTHTHTHHDGPWFWRRLVSPSPVSAGRQLDCKAGDVFAHANFREQVCLIVHFRSELQ